MVRAIALPTSKTALKRCDGSDGRVAASNLADPGVRNRQISLSQSGM